MDTQTNVDASSSAGSKRRVIDGCSGGGLFQDEERAKILKKDVTHSAEADTESLSLLELGRHMLGSASLPVGTKRSVVDGALRGGAFLDAVRSNHMRKDVVYSVEEGGESLPCLGLGKQARSNVPTTASTRNIAHSHSYNPVNLPCAVSVGSASICTEEKHRLYVKQVQVLDKKLGELLPSLPLALLSDEFVQQKLELYMQKPRGRLSKFVDEIHMIWRAYVNTHMTRPVQTCGPSEQEPAKNENGIVQVCGLSEEEAGSRNISEDATQQPQAHEPDEPQQDEPEATKPTVWPWERHCVDVDSSPEMADVTIVEPVTAETPQEQESASDFSEGFATADPYMEGDEIATVDPYIPLAASICEAEEIDDWGFQIAVDEMEDAPSTEVVLSILKMLLGRRPAKSVLEDGLYVDALAPQLAEPAESPIGSLAREVCSAWGHASNEVDMS